MEAAGANLRGLLADDHVTAVAADPDAVSVAREDHAVLDVLGELAIALLVVLLDGADHAELGSNFLEAFFVGFLGHAVVHVGPFEVLAGSSLFEVGDGVVQLASVKIFEPELGMFFFVPCRFQEDRRDLLVTLFLCLGGEVGVLVAGLGFACEGFHQVLFGLCSFKVFHGM